MDSLYNFSSNNIRNSKASLYNNELIIEIENFLKQYYTEDYKHSNLTISEDNYRKSI